MSYNYPLFKLSRTDNHPSIHLTNTHGFSDGASNAHIFQFEWVELLEVRYQWKKSLLYSQLIGKRYCLGFGSIKLPTQASRYSSTLGRQISSRWLTSDSFVKTVLSQQLYYSKYRAIPNSVHLILLIVLAFKLEFRHVFIVFLQHFYNVLLVFL